jgi:hypothetical protein
MITPVTNTISIFRSQIERCVQANEEKFLLELQRLVAILNGNSHLQRCVYEIHQDADNWGVNFQRKEAKAQNQIIELKNLLISRYPEIEEEEEGAIPDIHPTIIHFNRVLSGGMPIICLEPDPYDDPSLNRRLFLILRKIWGRHSPVPNEISEQIDKFVYEIDYELGYLNNERLNFVRSHPGVLWVQICQAVEEINPLPKPLFNPIDIYNLMFEAIHGIPFRKVLYGWRSNRSNIAPSEQDKARYQSWKDHITEGLRLLESEISVRLTTKISSEWAIRKYVARTSIYRYSEIRHNLEQVSATSKANGKNLRLENYLVDDAAAYLFDMGFGVLTERHLAGGRLDIYEETLGVEAARDALLIEAKIYTSATNGETAFKKGLSQIYGYASSIESSFHPTENYLLLFRLDGPKLVLPRKPVTMGEYSFMIVHVDLAPSEISGSRSPKPKIINVEKIIDQIMN